MAKKRSSRSLTNEFVEAADRNDSATMDRIQERDRLRAHKKELEDRKKLEKEVQELRLWELEQEYENRSKLEKDLAKEREKYQKDRLGYIQDKAVDITNSIISKVDGTVNEYVKNIQVLSAHLQGTSKSYTDMTDTLQNALSGQGIVSQQKVFSHLTEYVRSGITYNVEQRAFLKTIAEDMGMVFGEWSSSMNQLVRIQGQDSTANRLALEYSLQEFLNQNYKTSEYIASTFASVSEHLLAAQSTMTADNAMAFESVVQTWLGSLSSAGLNQSTITSLADAINALGSGDISKIGTDGISNLVLMGAARAGLDYGQLLNQGLTASTTDQLLAGISGYLNEMGNNQSNVVKSQLGKVFGVSITDLIASQNLRATSGGVTTDVTGMLNDMTAATPDAVKVQNLLENVLYTLGTNIASNPFDLFGYQAGKMIAGTLGSALDGLTINAGIGELNVGKLLQAAPLIGIIPSILRTVGDVSQSFISRTNGLTSVFNSLGQAVSGTTVKISDAGVSGSAYFGSNLSSGDLLSSSMTSMNDLLGSSSVIQSDEPTLEDNVATITGDVAIIVDLLTTHLESIDDAVHNMSLENTMYNYARDALTF